MRGLFWRSVYRHPKQTTETYLIFNVDHTHITCDSQSPPQRTKVYCPLYGFAPIAHRELLRREHRDHRLEERERRVSREVRDEEGEKDRDRRMLKFIEDGPWQGNGRMARIGRFLFGMHWLIIGIRQKAGVRQVANRSERSGGVSSPRKV